MLSNLRRRRMETSAGRRRLLRRFLRHRNPFREIATIKRQIKDQKELAYSDKNISLVGVTTSGSSSNTFDVPTRGDNFRGNRQGNIVYVTKQEFYITVVGAEDTAGLTSDVYNLMGIKVGYIKNNNASSTFPTITGGGGSLWDNGLMTDNAFLPLLPEGPDMQNIHIQKRIVKRVAGVDTATAGSAGQTYVQDHVKFLKFDINYKKPLKIRYQSLDTNVQSTYLDAYPFIAWVSDSSITPNPSIAIAVRTWYLT